MPTEAMLNAPPRRPRTGLRQLIALWGVLPRTIRRFTADFATVFAEEGRELPARLGWSAVALVIAGILVLTGWLLLCVATASWLAAAQGWRWEIAVYLVALANVICAVIALVVSYRALKPPYFPFTTYGLQRLRSNGSTSAEDEAPPPNPGPRERALLRSEAELEARLSAARRETPRLIATPSVIAATAGVGFVVGFITKRRARTTVVAGAARPATFTRQLANIAFGQLSSLAVAAALRELQRRSGHDIQLY